MITTPTVPAAGTSGRAASVVAPMQQIADQAAQQRALALANQSQAQARENVAEANQLETAQAVAPLKQSDRSKQFFAEREHAMRARLTEQLAEAADQEVIATEPAEESDGPKRRKIDAIDLLPPPATEVLARGGRQTRVEARAELFEAEARLRMLEQASAGYEESRSATS